MTDSPTDDVHPHRLQAVVESTQAKAVSRLATPLIGVMLAVIGFFLVRTLNEVVANQDRQDTRQEDQGRDIAQVKSDVRVIGTRLDEGVIRQVNQNSNRVDAIEQRVQKLERVVKTP